MYSDIWWPIVVSSEWLAVFDWLLGTRASVVYTIHDMECRLF